MLILSQKEKESTTTISQDPYSPLYVCSYWRHKFPYNWNCSKMAREKYPILGNFFGSGFALVSLRGLDKPKGSFSLNFDIIWFRPKIKSAFFYPKKRFLGNKNWPGHLRGLIFNSGGSIQPVFRLPLPTMELYVKIHSSKRVPVLVVVGEGGEKEEKSRKGFWFIWFMICGKWGKREISCRSCGTTDNMKNVGELMASLVLLGLESNYYTTRKVGEFFLRCL